MGMMFGGWAKEEQEEFIQSGLTWEEFQAKKKYESENIVYKQLKKARYKGIELCEGDMITNDICGKHYIIRDFTKDAVPIVDEISIKKGEVNKIWDFETLYIVGNLINN